MTIRGGNATVQASPSSAILNKTINALTVFTNSSYHHNMTADELTLALGDPYSEINIIEYKNYASFIIPFLLVVVILVGIVNYVQINGIKDKLQIPSLMKWAKNMYEEYTVKNVLPVYHKKAKQSPFIGAQPCPLTLPACPRLDNTEKGQNLKFQFSIPYRRFQSSENLNTNEEHRITITTVVQKTPEQSQAK
jgi:hypothetical protein